MLCPATPSGPTCPPSPTNLPNCPLVHGPPWASLQALPPCGIPPTLMLVEVLDGSADFMDGEGVLLYLPPLSVVEDFGEAFDFVLGVWVYCALGGGVLVEEAVLVGLEHCGWVVGEGAVLASDRGNGAVACVGHGIVQVAYGLVLKFVVGVPFMFPGNALCATVACLLGCRLSSFCSLACDGGLLGCLCGRGWPGTTSHAKEYGAYPRGPWVLGRLRSRGIVGSRK